MKKIYLRLAHMSEDGYEMKFVKEHFDTNGGPFDPNVIAFETNLERFVCHTDNASSTKTRKARRH